MGPYPQSNEFSPESNKNERRAFPDKFRSLLPGTEFEESADMLEARTAVLEALLKHSQNIDLLQAAWAEYAEICEKIVDDRTESSPRIRAQLQIAILVHKALIFREAKDMQRYGEDLAEARGYAYNIHLDDIVEAIDTELDELVN